MKIIKKQTNAINVGDMKDGQIAEIVEWDGTEHYVGNIVQRYDSALIQMGKPSNQGWGNVFKPSCSFLHDGKHRVEILNTGTLLEVE